MERWNPNQPMEDGLPPQEIRFQELRVEPWADHPGRVRIILEISPFLERPDIEAVILDKNGQEAASINIVESIDTRMTFTMHLRENGENGPYTVNASISYPNIGTVNQANTTFNTQTPSA